MLNITDVKIRLVTGDGGKLTLILQGHDADWNVVETPISGAKITLNGADTGLVTGDDGSVVLETPAEPGNYIVSATYDGAVIVPPIYAFTVPAAE